MSACPPTVCRKTFIQRITSASPGCPVPATLTIEAGFIAAVNAFVPNSNFDGILHLTNPDCAFLEYQMADPLDLNNVFVLNLVYGVGHFAFSGQYAWDGAAFQNATVGTLIPNSSTNPVGSYQIGSFSALPGYPNGSFITIS